MPNHAADKVTLSTLRTHTHMHQAANVDPRARPSELRASSKRCPVHCPRKVKDHKREATCYSESYASYLKGIASVQEASNQRCIGDQLFTCPCPPMFNKESGELSTRSTVALFWSPKICILCQISWLQDKAPSTNTLPHMSTC